MSDRPLWSQQQYNLGYQHGQDDGTHPLGAVMHYMARNPGSWAQESGSYRSGYEEGWESVR